MLEVKKKIGLYTNRVTHCSCYYRSFGSSAIASIRQSKGNELYVRVIWADRNFFPYVYVAGCQLPILSHANTAWEHLARA